MRTTAEDRKRTLIAGLVQTRRDLLAEIESLSPARLDEIFLGEWCVKDLLAHLIGWDYTNQEAIQQILAGKPPSFFQYYDKDWRSYNALLVARHKIEPFSTLLLSLQASHQALLDLLESLPARDLLAAKAPTPSGRSVTVRGLLSAEARDERQHAAQVRQWRSSWQTPDPAASLEDPP